MYNECICYVMEPDFDVLFIVMHVYQALVSVIVLN